MWPGNTASFDTYVKLDPQANKRTLKGTTELHEFVEALQAQSAKTRRKGEEEERIEQVSRHS